MAIEEFLQTADLLPEAMLLCGVDGEIRAANRAVVRIGLAPDALAGTRLADVASAPPGEIVRYLRSCARTRQLVPGTLALTRPGEAALSCRVEGCAYRPASHGDGRGALILLRIRPKDDVIGRFLLLNQKIDELSREIVRRRAIEAELRDQREWFRVVLTSIGDAVIATDRLGRVVFMNHVAEGLTGWPQAEAAGEPLERAFRIVNESTRETVENPVARVLREGNIVGLANHTILLSRDGAEWPIDDSAAPIRNERGETEGVVLIFRDVGERRRLEQELEERARRLAEMDRRKDEFLAMLAHELRNPLAPMAHSVALLRSPDREEADLRWATEILGRQIRHMSLLVDDLLDVSRIVYGKIELRREPVDLVPILRHAVEVALPAIEARRHELVVSLPAEPVAVHVDPTRIEQVLVNLLNNAAKYTEPGGRIWFEAERIGDEAVVRVRDTGVGIDPAMLQSVFELFTQAEQSLARSQGGLGIGLTLVRTLVGLHGGRVSAASAGLGQGSEFVVRLPALGVEGRPGDRRRTGPEGGTAAPRRVLIVDDNADSARTLARLLGRAGHVVEVIHDGCEALARADAFAPEVVLLDIGLPGLDGFEVARRLRIAPATRRALLIAVTGYGQESDRQKARLAGFDLHFLKPIDISTLQETLARGAAAADHSPPDRPEPDAPGRDLRTRT